MLNHNAIATLTAAIISFSVFPASAAIIEPDVFILDFNELIESSNTFVGNTYEKDGFRLTASGQGLYVRGDSSPSYTGTPNLYSNEIGGSIELTLINGGLFTLLAIDLDTIFETDISVITFVTNNGDEEVFTTGEDQGNLQRHAFGLEFDEITSVTWYQDEPFHQFDNLELTKEPFPSAVVPVPAAVWLFGSGLLGLVGIARRKNK